MRDLDSDRRAPGRRVGFPCSATRWRAAAREVSVYSFSRPVSRRTEGRSGGVTEISAARGMEEEGSWKARAGTNGAVRPARGRGGQKRGIRRGRDEAAERRELSSAAADAT